MATIHWNTGISGNFNTPSDWSAGTVPGSSDDALIDASGTYTVSSSSNELINSLTIGGGATLAISGATSVIAINGFNNFGTVDEIGTGPTSILQLIPGSNANNVGIIEVGTDSSLDDFGATLTNSGQLLINGGGMAFQGSVNGGGTVAISNGGSLAVIEGVFSNNISFAAGTIGEISLGLDAPSPASITGIISGFSAGDEIRVSGASPLVTYIPNQSNTGGTLNIGGTPGTTISLLGSYLAAGFHVENNEITYSAPPLNGFDATIVPGGRITQGFDAESTWGSIDAANTSQIPPADFNNLLTHPAVDIVAPLGTAVDAFAGGSVALVSSGPSDPNWNSLGWYVLVHDSGSQAPSVAGGQDFYTLYVHLENQPLVSVNQTISAGSQIGDVGQTGFETGMQPGEGLLHFEIRLFSGLFHPSLPSPSQWSAWDLPKLSGLDDNIYIYGKESPAQLLADPDSTGLGYINPQNFLIESSAGRAIDGYLAGATVFADANGNGQLDPGEAFTTTDANGTFTLISGTGPLIVFGGTDISTGMPFQGQLEAPTGSLVITPLTTLVSALQSLGNVEAQEAQLEVLSAFSLNTNLDLTTLDPVAGTQSGDAASSAAYVSGAKAINTVDILASALTADGGSYASASQGAFAAIAAAVNNLSAGQTLNLSNNTTVLSLIDSVAQTESLNVAQNAAVTAMTIALSNGQLDQDLQNDHSGAQLLGDASALQVAISSGVLVGGSGNDTFYALGSSLNFSGGGGHDTIVFDGSSSQYTLTNNGNGSVTVLDSVANRDGTHTLTNVEFLQFTDQSIFVENSSNASIALLYSAALNRTPDTAGLGGWEDFYTNQVSAVAKGQGVYVALAETPLQVNGLSIADGFIQSAEFQHTYGSLNNTQFVTQLYANVLDRAPDAAGLAGWLSLMENQGYTQGMVLVGFAESTENIAGSAHWLITA